MRRGTAIMLCAALLAGIGGTPPMQAQTMQSSGDWTIGRSRNPITDGAIVIAATGSPAGVGLFIKCADGNLSIGLNTRLSADPAYVPRAFYAISFRADRGKVIETRARAISNRLLDFDMTEADAGVMARAALGAAGVAVRVGDALLNPRLCV